MRKTLDFVVSAGFDEVSLFQYYDFEGTKSSMLDGKLSDDKLSERVSLAKKQLMDIGWKIVKYSYNVDKENMPRKEVEIGSYITLSRKET